MSAPANLKPHHDIQGTTVNWVDGEPRLACCVCDNYQQAINTRYAPRFLLQPTVQSVCGHTGSQCFDEGDRGNWADRWFHRTRVGTRVGHTGPGYPSTRVLTSLCWSHSNAFCHCKISCKNTGQKWKYSKKVLWWGATFFETPGIKVVAVALKSPCLWWPIRRYSSMWMCSVLIESNLRAISECFAVNCSPQLLAKFSVISYIIFCTVSSHLQPCCLHCC